MFFRITSPKNNESAAFPASIYLQLDEIERVVEKRNRIGSDTELQLQIFMKDGHQENVSESSTSKATMLAIIAHLEKNCINPKKEDPKWKETEDKVADVLSKQEKPKERKAEPAMAG